MMHPLRIAGALVAVLTFGCTGQVADAGGPGGDAGRDGSPSGDGGTGPCPATAPAKGTACSRESLECEYGSSLYAGCNEVVQCSSGRWQGSLLGSFCPGPNPSSCPATMAAATGACTAYQSCYYEAGGCYCGPLGGPVQVGPDGGIPDQTWSCDDPGAGCPLPRPRLGTSCSQEGQSCQYLQCSYSQQCQGGVWMAYPEGCALAGGAGGG